MIKARFYVAEFNTKVVGHTTPDRTTPVLQAEVVLRAVTRKDTEDNIDWAKYSPSGSMTLMVSPAGGAFEAFEALLGKDVSVSIEGIAEEQL